MYEFELTFNAVPAGTIMEKDFDAALRSAMLQLGIKELHHAELKCGKLKMEWFAPKLTEQNSLYCEAKYGWPTATPYNQGDGFRVWNRHHCQCDWSGLMRHRTCFRPIHTTVYADDANGWSQPVLSYCRKHSGTDETEVNYHEGRRQDMVHPLDIQRKHNALWIDISSAPNFPLDRLAFEFVFDIEERKDTDAQKTPFRFMFFSLLHDSLDEAIDEPGLTEEEEQKIRALPLEGFYFVIHFWPQAMYEWNRKQPNYYPMPGTGDWSREVDRDSKTILRILEALESIKIEADVYRTVAAQQAQ
jgi:hypothetical protein